MPAAHSSLSHQERLLRACLELDARALRYWRAGDRRRCWRAWAASDRLLRDWARHLLTSAA